MSQFAFLQAEFADIFHPDVTDGTIADTLAKRLFSARVELVGEVDGDGSATSTTDGYVQEPTPHGHMGEAGSGPDRVAEIKKLRDGLAAELRTEISGHEPRQFFGSAATALRREV
jgi:type I restriction enzyme R subunit